MNPNWLIAIVPISMILGYLLCRILGNVGTIHSWYADGRHNMLLEFNKEPSVVSNKKFVLFYVVKESENYGGIANE